MSDSIPELPQNRYSEGHAAGRLYEREYQCSLLKEKRLRIRSKIRVTSFLAIYLLLGCWTAVVQWEGYNIDPLGSFFSGVGWPLYWVMVGMDRAYLSIWPAKKSATSGGAPVPAGNLSTNCTYKSDGYISCKPLQ